MNKELHNKVHTFRKALSLAKRNQQEPYYFTHYTALALAWARSDSELNALQNLLTETYEQIKTKETTETSK